MSKQQRKIYEGEKNNKARTMGKLVSAVGVVLKDKGYTGLTIANISKVAGVDRKLITLYFGSVENLVETYIKGKDYWIGATKGAEAYFNETPNKDAKAFLESLILDYMEEFSKNEEMQKVVTWQVSEKSDIMSHVTKEREKMSALCFAFTDKELQGKDIDLRAVSAILVSAIYHLILHAKYTDSTFCEVDIQTDEGMDRIRKAVKQILDLVFSATV